MASIFVNISSYRDAELKPTILDILQKSSVNHQINFGIHISYLDESEIDLPDISNIKYTISKVPKNLGVGQGRYLAHKFYDNEDFYFQCDSHSRFTEGWDEIVMHSLLDYKIQGISKPLLTMYPSNYWYTDETFTKIETDNFDQSYRTNISFHEKPENFKNLRIPSQTAMPCGNNIFTKSSPAKTPYSFKVLSVPKRPSPTKP